MGRRKYILGRMFKIIDDMPACEDILDMLEEEGVLHLGYGEPDVDLILSTFKEIFGTTKASRQDRWAANRMAAKYGSQAVAGIIRALGAQTGSKYAPIVNNVAEMENKMVSILNFLRKNDDETIQTT